MFTWIKVLKLLYDPEPHREDKADLAEKKFKPAIESPSATHPNPPADQGGAGVLDGLRGGVESR
jgi:hypothetical protein